MAVGKEIRGKIKSVENTKKITKAMEMVAASKMRKAQDRMRAARPYAEKLRSVIGHLRLANPDHHNPFQAASRDNQGRHRPGAGGAALPDRHEGGAVLPPAVAADRRLDHASR